MRVIRQSDREAASRGTQLPDHFLNFLKMLRLGFVSEIIGDRMSENGRQFDHGPIIARLRDRSLIPFLGAAASFVGASSEKRLPDGARLAQELLEGIRYPGAANDSLTKIA
jgi:hypothetical protein